MKLNENYVCRTIGDVTVLLPVERGEGIQQPLVCHNKTASFLARCLEEEISEADLVRVVMEHFEGSYEDVAMGISGFLNVLREAGALDEGVEPEV